MATTAPPDPRGLVGMNLASISVSGLLYGIFFVLFSASTYLMARRQNRLISVHSGGRFRAFKNPFQISGILFFATITGNWVVIVYRSFEAFLYYQGGSMPAEYYIATPESEVLKVGFMLGTVVIADAMLVYRLWVIYARNRYVILFPLFTFAASVGLCIAILIRLKESASLIAAARILLEGCWVCSVCTNLYCCVMIAWRLYRASSLTAQLLMQSETRSVYRALLIFIESAALFVGWEIIFMICYKFSTRGYPTFLIEDTWPIVCGIAFMLINIRVGMGYTTETTPRAGLTSPAFAKAQQISLNMTFSGAESSIAMEDREVDKPIAPRPEQAEVA